MPVSGSGHQTSGSLQRQRRESDSGLILPSLSHNTPVLSTPAPTSSAIRRIRQACTNCRNRKTRCSGDRPRCRTCRRSGRVCHYGPSTNPATASSTMAMYSALEEHDATDRLPHQSKLLQRINVIESELAQLSGKGCVGPRFVPTQYLMSKMLFLTTHPSLQLTFRLHSLFTTLPPPAVVQSLVDTYFNHIHNQPYSYFQEDNFRQKCADGLLPKCLFFAVLASALRFSGDKYYKGSIHEAMEAYAREAWLSVLHDHMTADDRPNLHVAQTTSILAIIDFTAGRTSSAWLKIGLAIRISQDLQLMEEPNITLPAIEQEERRRVFWSVYLLDKLVSCGRGRPSAVFAEDCHVQLPCDEETFRAGASKKTTTLQQLLSWDISLEGSTSNFSLMILAASVLGRCARYVLYERDADNTPPWASHSEFATINSLLILVEHHLQVEEMTLDDILDRHRKADGSLDNQVMGHILFPRVALHLCHCLLNHPLLLRLRLQKLRSKICTPFFCRALQTSCDHACKLVALLDNKILSNAYMQSSFYAYAASVAGGLLFMVIHAEQDKGKTVAPRFLLGSQQALKVLEWLGRFWDHATNMYNKLLSFSAYAHDFTAIIDPSTEPDIDSALTSTVWLMVDYGAMCSSSRMTESISKDGTSLASPFLSMLDFDVGLGASGDSYSTISGDVGGAADARVSTGIADLFK
ncbi:fungal-specific transcription factor domain-containing protein [Ilyonectria destructans]|nr:fungal-specific transcription factor domain-containing protein [Ilyonectria destructans]